MAYQYTSSNTIFRSADGAFIPTDPANVDYQVYMAWLEEGNSPEQYPEPESPSSLTPEEKLEASGLTLEELKQLLGL